MSFSIYYEANREQPLTSQEKVGCDKIIEKYCLEYPFNDKMEDFGVYDADDIKIVFSGSVKLPEVDAETMFSVANYWLKCLTEITTYLSKCVWTVTFEEVPLIFAPDDGWRFPTDEEYNQ